MSLNVALNQLATARSLSSGL